MGKIQGLDPGCGVQAWGDLGKEQDSVVRAGWDLESRIGSYFLLGCGIEAQERVSVRL